MWKIFCALKLSAAWNVGPIRQKYPRILELPKVSSLDFGNGSKVTEPAAISGAVWLELVLLPLSSFAAYMYRFKLKTTVNCLCGSVGDSDNYVFACPLIKDFHLVSPSQNAKKA
ncbi:hypothetical protein TNCV_2438281 [Trichonephila clavipes]|nr:hypothetical protein TNCV_2438281 [Trichonephila clavipes]